MNSMAAGVFKDQCLKVLDRVAATRTPVVVTKRGRPVAKVVPFESSAADAGSLAGSLIGEHGDVFGTGEAWDDDRS